MFSCHKYLELCLYLSNLFTLQLYIEILLLRLRCGQNNEVTTEIMDEMTFVLQRKISSNVVQSKSKIEKHAAGRAKN